MEEIKSAVYATLGMVVLVFINQVIVFIRWDKMEKSERHIPMLENTTRRARLFFQVVGSKMKRPRKLVNMGDVKPIPDVPPELERWMARELLRELDGGKMVDEVSLSVSAWKGRWTGTQEQFAALMDKWQGEGIVYRKNKRGDRAFVQPSRPSIHARLKMKLGN